MLKITETFERLTKEKLQDIFWEKKRISPTEHCIVLGPRSLTIRGSVKQRFNSSGSTSARCGSGRGAICEPYQGCPEDSASVLVH